MGPATPYVALVSVKNKKKYFEVTHLSRGKVDDICLCFFLQICSMHTSKKQINKYLYHFHASRRRSYFHAAPQSDFKTAALGQIRQISAGTWAKLLFNVFFSPIHSSLRPVLHSAHLSGRSLLQVRFPLKTRTICVKHYSSC